jgi:acetyltransferase-like isoleucine patch superfamily enzyme
VPPWARRVAAAAIDVAWTWVTDLGAIGPNHPRARRFGAFGEGSLIAFPPGAIFNERWIRIGAHTMIGPYVSLSAGMAPGQEMVSDPVVSIGDRTLIGRGSHIVGHFSVEIGDDIQTGPYVYITDQNHVYEDPDLPIGAQWPVESSVFIGSGSWLGTGVVVLPGSHIGRNVAIGAGSVVTGEIPDHSVAVGAPAKVVKRYTPDEGWRATDQAPAVAAKRTVAKRSVAKRAAAKVAGETVTGETVTGETVTGEKVTGEKVTGEKRAGQKLAGSRGLTAAKKKNSTTRDPAPPTT